MKAGKLARYGLLLSVMLVLGYVESLLPAAGMIPGMKLGLANTVLLYALYLMGTRSALVLAVMKVLLSGFLFGSPSAMLYSAAGAALSLLAMIALRRIARLGPTGVSIAGAVCHNIGQCAAALLFIPARAVLAYLPALLLSAAVTGAVTGVTATYLLGYFKKK